MPFLLILPLPTPGRPLYPTSAGRPCAPSLLPPARLAPVADQQAGLALWARASLSCAPLLGYLYSRTPTRAELLNPDPDAPGVRVLRNRAAGVLLSDPGAWS